MNALEIQILPPKFVGAIDANVREMSSARSSGDSGKEFGRQFGINAHSPELQFWCRAKNAKRVLEGDAEPKKPRRRHPDE